MYLEIFLADFAVFRVFLGISQVREISEALTKGKDVRNMAPPSNSHFNSHGLYNAN